MPDSMCDGPGINPINEPNQVPRDIALMFNGSFTCALVVDTLSLTCCLVTSVINSGMIRNPKINENRVMSVVYSCIENTHCGRSWFVFSAKKNPIKNNNNDNRL